MDYDILNQYRNLSYNDKNNLLDYLIYDGIFQVYPLIPYKEAMFIFKICKRFENKNINPFSVAHFLTEHYISGEITKVDLENATSGQISEAVYFDKLHYIFSQDNKKQDFENSKTKNLEK